MSVEGVNGILNVESAALHAPQVGVANTNPQHILSVGSNLYVSGDSPDVLTVDGNVVCEGVKVGLIEIIPSYDLEAVANVGNSTSNTIQFTNPDTGIVTTGNVSVGKTLTVEGFRITAQAEANDDLQAITLAGADTNQAIHITNASDSVTPYTGALQIGTNTGNNGGLGVAGNVHIGRGLFVDTDTLVVDSTNDRVGIGKTNPDATLDVDGDAIIRGGLSVLGTTTTIDTENLRVQDPIIELGKDNAGTGDLGLIMTRPSGSSNVAMIFDENTDTLKLGYTNGGASDTTITMDSAPLSVNVNGNLSVTSNLEVGTANLFVDTVNSRVGVGTSIPTESLDVVGNMNLQQVSNVASIKLNSNVVTEFNRSKKLIKYPRVGLGTNTSAYSGLGGGSTVSGYTIKASGEYDPNFLASKAFTNTNDDDDLDTWITASGAYSSNTPVANSATLTKFGQQGSWLEIKLPNKIQLHYTHVFTRRTHITERNDTADIWASNTGTDGDWVKLTTINFNDAYTDVIPMVADIDTLTYYQYFAIQITRVAWSGIYANIGEWELFGTPEYDPEADGVDVVVKSVPNVPNTDWLEVYYDAKNYTSGVVQDLSTNSFDGTLTNGASFNNSDGIDKFVFDGTNDYISGSIPSTFTGNQTYTFSIWVKPNSHPSSGFVGVFEVGTRSNDDAMGLYFDTGKIIHLAYADNLATTTYATIGEWVHITGTYTSGDRRVYANGNLLKQDDYSDLTLAGTTFKLGSNLEGTQAFDGSIANFRLFNRALTSDEIWQLYAYQKEYFGHGDLSMTLKAGRLGIGTSEPKVALDVRGDIHANGGQSWPIPCAIFSNVTPSNTGSTYYENNIGTIDVNYNNISLEDPSGTIQASVGSPNITLNRVGMYEFHTESSLKLQSAAGSSHIGQAIINAGVSGSGVFFETDGYELVTTTYNTLKLVNRTYKVLVTSAPYVVTYRLQPIANYTDRFIELAYGNNRKIHSVSIKYLG